MGVRFLTFGCYKYVRFRVRFFTFGGKISYVSGLDFLRLGIRLLTFGCYKSLRLGVKFLTFGC